MRALQDPAGCAGGLAVLGGLLGDSGITRSLGSQLPDGPAGIRDGGYDEANHQGSENGWARLSVSVPIRQVGLGSVPPIRQCNDSVCFCEGMKDCRLVSKSYRAEEDRSIGPEKRPLNRADPADEWHQKQLKGKPSPHMRCVGWKQVDPGEVRRLLAEMGGLTRRSTELSERAEILKGRLEAHCKFGEELQWDYDSDDVSDTRLIMNSSEFDVEGAKLDYDTARFRLLIF